MNYLNNSKAELIKALESLEAEIERLREEGANSADLRESFAKESEMLHLLLNHSFDAIYFKDRESRFIRISKAHAKLFDLDDPEKAIGKTDFDFFPIEHAREAFRDEQEIIKTGKPLVGKIERETAPGEPEHWVFTTKMPIFDNRDKVTGTFGISRDITEVKTYESALQKAKSELEERVRERTADLRKSHAQLEKRIAQLDFLTAASYEMAQHIRVEELAPVILKAFLSRLPQGTASCCIRTPKGFTCKAAMGVLDSEGGRVLSEKVLNDFHRLHSHRPLIVENWPSDEHIRTFSWPELRRFPFYIAIPLLAENQLVGAIQIFTGAKALTIYQDEEKVLATLAAHSAVSLSNALNYEEIGEKARLQGELDAARSIQQRLTPSQKPSIPHVNLKGLYSPAFEVGGDYMDYFKTETGHWVVAVADVCGKGIPAALLMTMLRSAFRVEARTETSARRLLCAVNDSMHVNLDDRSFVTALCLVINPEGTSMSYARAGHPKMIRTPAKAASVEVIQSEGIALGFISDADAFAAFMDEVTLPLKPGDRYLIYTDGLTESINKEKNVYGSARLLGLLASSPRSTPEALLEAIMDDLRQFSMDAPPRDDLTIVALEVTP